MLAGMAKTKAKKVAKPAERLPRSVTLKVTISGDLLADLHTVATKDRTKKAVMAVVDDALRHHVRDRFGFIERRKTGLVVIMGRLVRR